MAYISNSTSNSLVSGTSSADTIYSSASNVTISGGAGNDSIYNNWWGSSISINGGAGNDTLFTKSDGGKTLTGGAGSDRFVLYYDTDGLYGTDVITDYAEADTIQFNNVSVTSVSLSGNNVVFTVGNNKLNVKNAATKTVTYIDSNGTRKTFRGAADSINNTTSNTVVSGTSGNDKITNSGGNVTINAGDGNDTIYTGDGFYTKVNGGNGNDSIYSNWGSFDTIDAGNGNDSIVIYGSGYESVNGGAGNDLISLGGSSSGFTKSIKGGTGNDTVYHGSNHYLLYQYASGDGNDIIYNWTSNDTLQIGGGSGTYSSQTSGSNIVVTVGDGSITLKGAASLSAVNIRGVKRNFIENYTSNTLVSGTSSADTIYSSAENVTISGGNGNDSLYNNYWSSSVSINGGAGNDTLFTKSDGGKTLTGGAGSDRFIFYYDTDTLKGTDVITDYAEADTIQFNNVSVTSVSVSGNNVVFKVGNNKLNVKNAATKTVTYIDSDGTTKTFRGASDVIENSTSNTVVSGTSGNDKIYNSGNYVTINAYAGNDSIHNSAYYVTINAGDGADTINNYSGDYVSINAGAGNDSIVGYSYNWDDTIIAGDGNDTIIGFGRGASIDAGAGNDRISLGASSSTAQTVKGGAGNDTIYGSSSTVGNLYQYTSGDGNDSIVNFKANDTLQIGGGSGTYSSQTSGSNIVVTVGDGSITLKGAASLSSVNIRGNVIENYTSNTLVRGTSSADTIYSSASNVTISGGAGNDSIYNNWWGSSISINGGAGNDTLYTKSDGGKTLTGGAGSDRFVFYYDTDTLKGTDVITDYAEADTIQFENVAVTSVSLSGNNVVFKVGNNKLNVKNAATKTVTYIDSNGTRKTYRPETNSWTFSGTTAKYGTSANTLITVTGVKGLGGISLSGTTVTVANSSTNNSNITISGTGYTLALASDVPVSRTTKAWSLSGKTAKYNQTTTAGYTLASNAKSAAYSANATTTLATVKGVKSLAGLSLNQKVVTVSTASLGTDKVTISGTGYTLNLADVPVSRTTAAGWTKSGTTATYKSASTTAGYKLASDAKSISYSGTATPATTLASIKGVTSTSGLTVSGKTIKPATTSLAKKVTVSGAYTFDFAANYSKATITGSASNDTIVARGKNISVNGGNGNDTIKMLGTGSVTGGAGADVFYYESSGANVITDYAAEDKISVASGTAATATSGDDLILTVGKGEISVKGGEDKVVTYIDSNGTHVYKKTPSGVKFNDNGTSAVLKVTYTADTFDIADYAEYKDTLVTINSSAVKHKLEIMGNKNANTIVGTGEDDFIDGRAGSDNIKGGAGNDTIEGGEGNDKLYGGSGDDSLWGGAGSDTLYGNSGDDTFIYYEGNGKDVIADFERGDIIKVISANIENPYASGSDVVFEVGRGKIVVSNGVDKFIQLYGENGGELAQKWNPQRVSSS